MSDEYMQHCQCQTCFVRLPTNQELIQHIEEYRSEERILVARLERCRLHLAQSYDIGRGEADDQDRDGGDDDHESTAQPDLLKCPAPGCKREERFTVRHNLTRHFQTHIECHEMCPSCLEIFTRVDRFVRHTCKGRSDTVNTYIQHRVAQFNSKIAKQLNMLQSPPSHTKRRAQEADGVLTRAQKMVKTTQISVPPNSSSDSFLSVVCSTTTGDVPTYHSEPLKVMAANGTGGTHTKKTAMRHSNHTELTLPSVTTIDTPANSGGGGWAFAKMPPALPTNDSGWAFAEAPPVLPANDSGWAFAEAPPALPANDSEWALSGMTMHTNKGEWSFPEREGDPACMLCGHG